MSDELAVAQQAGFAARRLAVHGYVKLPPAPPGTSPDEVEYTIRAFYAVAEFVGLDVFEIPPRGTLVAFAPLLTDEARKAVAIAESAHLN